MAYGSLHSASAVLGKYAPFSWGKVDREGGGGNGSGVVVVVVAGGGVRAPSDQSRKREAASSAVTRELWTFRESTMAGSNAVSP